MPKPAGKVEINTFVDPELKAAVQRKCKVNGWTMNFVVERFLREWSADAPPPIESAKIKRKRD